MSDKKHSDIRLLALAFYRGWIPREKYVGLRKEYLDAVSAGKKPKPIDGKALAPPKRKSHHEQTGSEKLSSGKKPLLIAGIVTALIVLLVVISLSGEDDDSTDKQAMVESTKVSSPGAEAPVDTIETRFNTYLSSTFIQNREWNPESLNVLKFKWQSLSQEQQATIRSGSDFIRFGEILVEKVVTERKLDNIVPSDKELMLMTAARNMGLTGLLPEVN